MARFIVHRELIAGPATHAIVIGVGSYPHLVGGTGPLCDDNEGLGQLTSPPISAREFANWLIGNFDNPARPLASVALLVSEARNVVHDGTSEYRNPRTNEVHKLERATIDTVSAAVSEWKQRADASDANMTIFFFCGHGIALGTDAALLVEDFGEGNDDALDGAIDFRKFHLGMNRCAASHQCYFVDACRASSDMLLETREYMGRPLIQIVRSARRGKPTRQAPVFFASLGGDSAYARPGKASIFTEALMKSFNGAGSDDEEGDWRVNTNRLADALDYFMRREFESGGTQVQIPATGDNSKVQIHHVRSPQVPVEVWCKPDHATEIADLAWFASGGIRTGKCEAHQGKWTIELEPGEYEFRASFPNREFQDTTKVQYVRPAYRRVSLEVQP